MSRILYVGGFILPDKNAAAQRVMSIAKALRDLNHEVLFLNYSKETNSRRWTKYENFECYECPQRNLLSQITNIDDVISLLDECDVDIVIAYNYPSVCLKKLLLICHKRNIKIFADVTEWYVARGNPIFVVVKTLDSEYRMRRLHKSCDGVIAISRYLYDYYCNTVHTVMIPPTVDMSDAKWKRTKAISDDVTVFVYAGQPTGQKERLDKIVDQVERLAQNRYVKIHIVGITKEQYCKIYRRSYSGKAVLFHGRVSHTEAIEFVKEADWSIVIRDNNKVVKAGFPTKVVESLTCGTPVIANRFSNIDEYLNHNNSIICEMNELSKALEVASINKLESVNTSVFDYHNYLKELDALINGVI